MSWMNFEFGLRRFTGGGEKGNRANGTAALVIGTELLVIASINRFFLVFFKFHFVIRVQLLRNLKYPWYLDEIRAKQRYLRFKTPRLYET